jgi:hypothetical protein
MRKSNDELDSVQVTVAGYFAALAKPARPQVLRAT